LEDLKVLGTLGQGSFGHVQLVQLEHEGKTSTYALKGVAKRKIVETHQTMQIINEKKVMMDLRHPMIIQLYTTFKDADQLYFLLEPVLGGELFNLLQKKKRFTETAGRFYAGSVVLAFEYLHNKDYIFRDLKPENVLVDKEGYIKVADFGFAKRLRNNTQTWTMCGTPEYLCPEIIKSAGHGKGADWWTIGVLIFELLAGHTPFYHPSHLTMYNKIAHCRFKHPSHFSNGAKDLISGLLCLKPTQRLGVVKGGAEKVKNHDWFTSLDFEKLESKQYKAPFVPDVRDDADMSNFTKMDNDYRPPKYRETGNNWFEDF
jgi:serine/threonine protein kinase